MTHSARSLKALVLTAALVLPGLAFAADPAMADKNGMMTDHKGMTLYTFDKDAKGMSSCEATCTENWPPLKAAADAKAEGEWTLIKRKDGSHMWAYDGKALYTFAGDKKAGDMAGDGKGGVWHVAKAN